MRSPAGLKASSVLPSPRAPEGTCSAPPSDQELTGHERPLPSTLTSAVELQRVFDSWHDEYFSGADHACSLVIPDGRSLWLFGDTERGRMTADGSRASDERFVRSSFLLYGHRRLRVVYRADGGPVLPTGADDGVTWPHGAAVDRGVLHVFATRVRVTGGLALDFHNLDDVVVSYMLPPAQDPYPLAVRKLPAYRDQHWGAAATTAGGYLYIYATEHRQQRWVFGSDVYVARVASGHALDFAQWEFWDGDGWSRRAREARAVLDADGGPGTAMSVHQRSDGRWIMLSKQHDVFGQYVSLWAAPAPQGPWSLSKPAIAPAPSFVQDQRFTYNAFAHPEIPLVSGSLLVTVSRNSLMPADLQQDANLYMPQFLEVPLADIGGQLLPTRWQ